MSISHSFALLESAPDAIVVADREGRIRLVNRRTEELFGRGRDELLGEPVELLVPGRFAGAHARHRARYTDAPRTREMGAGLELYGRRKDGSEFPVEISLSPMEQEGEPLVIAFVRDVSERRAAERERIELAREQAARTEAEASRARLAAILADIDAVVWEAADPERRQYTFVSQRAVDLLGHPLERWREEGFWRDIIHPEDRAATVAFFAEAAASGKRRELEYRVRTAAGEILWVRDLAHATEGQAMRGVMVDVTERRELQGRLVRSQRLEAVGQLAGGVAHDFNNLLTVIAGFATLAQAKPEAAAVAEELGEIRRSTERAGELTGQLLAFSRRSPRSTELVEVNELVGRVETMMRRVVGEDVALSVRTAADLRPVMADPAQLEQVLVNLVMNSRDAMPRGGTIRMETALLDLVEGGALELPPGAYSVVVVSDTGIGMSEDTQARVFEPFFTTKPAGRGTGLGLATAYGIVEQAGGRITVSSEVGRGTDFAIYLPVADEAAELPAEHAAPTAPTVLLVEDEPALRKLAQRVLDEQRYRVIEAANGREAIEVAERHRGRIDLVVTDVVMPDVGGLELAEHLNRLRPGTKVLYMSGYTDSRLAGQGVAGDADILRKPFNPEDLAARVAELVGPA